MGNIVGIHLGRSNTVAAFKCGEVEVGLGGKEYQPEDIAAEILKKVVQDAEIYQSQRGQPSTITHAVITVPAYFSDKQRYATQTAAKRAGLAEPELLPEPTAAAISYGFKPDSDDVKTILVYDFGGEGFDSALITAAGNQFIESGKAGDLWLGGNDINDLMIQLVKKQVAAEENLDDIDGLIAKMPRYQKVRFLGDLKMAAEKAKIDLSSSTEARICPSTPLLDELGMAISINVTISRAQFEAMILPLVERTISICQEAIKYSDYPADMIDIILLVGGSSQIPLVQQKVREAFGAEKVVIHPRPMYAVAEGAAIVAAGLTEKVGTVSRDYFIQLPDEPRHKIIKQGDILPVRAIHTFRTEADGQSLIHFKFFNSDDVSHHDEKIGEVWIAFDKAYPQGTEVLVTAELDEKNSSLQITAALKNNPSVKVSCSFSRGGEDEKIAQKVEEIIRELNQEGTLTERGVQEAYRIAGEAIQATNQLHGQNGSIVEDRRQVAEQKLKELERLASNDYNLAGALVRDLEFAINTCAAIIPDSQQGRITSICDQLKKAIDDSNLSAIQKLIEDAKREFENLPELVKIVSLCADAIAQAHRIDPTQASLMIAKFNQMLSAIERGNTHQAEQLLQELLPDIQRYLDSYSEIPPQRERIFFRGNNLSNFIDYSQVATIIEKYFMKKIAPNPYDVIGVPQTASNAEITKSFAMAMKRREYPPEEIAKARKSLMNPEDRITADYLRPILPTIKRFKRQDFTELNEPSPIIEWLPDFDGLDEALKTMNNIEGVSDLDRQIGLSLFS